MGRRQLADRDALLDAAEAVVRRDGAARLTLEAVAAEAGVSKASVLYECKSKRGLVRAVMERCIGVDAAEVARHREALGTVPNAAVQAQIAAAAGGISAEDRELILPLTVVLAEDDELKEPIREAVATAIAEVRETSATPGGALLALLALEGMRSLERFDLYSFDAEERRRLLTDMAWLASQTPDAADTPEAAPVKESAP